jgi:chromosome segregation ATPase
MEYTPKKEEITTNFNQDYFKARFKKKLFGGYNPDEVIDFINAMHSNFQSSDQNLRKNIIKLSQDKQNIETELNSFKSVQGNDLEDIKSELESVLRELDEKNSIIVSNEAALDEYTYKLSEATEKYENAMRNTHKESSELEELLNEETRKNHDLVLEIVKLEEEIERLKLQVSELENLNDTSYLDEKAEVIKMEAFAEVNEEKRKNLGLQHEIKALHNHMADFEKSNETLLNKLYEEKNLRMAIEENLSEEKKKYADLQLNGLKKEFNNIQQFLEELSLEQEIKNKGLELELELEREKSKKAEDRIENLLMKYSALKDKVLWEKKQFMTKLSELADGHSKFVTDFNQVLTEVTPLESMEASNQ